MTDELRPHVQRWLESSKVLLYPYRPRFRDWRFWGIQALTLAIATVHFTIEALQMMELVPGSYEALSFLPVSMFFIPIVYAALNFGLSGALATAFWCDVLVAPNLIAFHHGMELPAELFQLGIVNMVTVVVGQRVDREIKARQLAQATSEALKSSEEKYRSLFESSPVAVLLLDTAGSIVGANPAAGSLFSIPITELPGVPVARLVGEAAAKKLLAGPPHGTHRSDLIILRPRKAPEIYLEPSVTRLTEREGREILRVLLTDITEERQRQAGLRAYAAHVLRAQEEERKRIAQELHDETVQGLVLLCRQLDMVSGTSRELSPASAASLQNARKSAEDAIGQLRGFARALRPPILEDLGVATALRRSLVELADRTRIDGQVRVTGKEHRFPAEIELGIFRIAQEALRNVERHAQASRVTVRISYTRSEMGLEIQDNGTGFEMQALDGKIGNHHLGLLGMRERAEALGGTLDVQSTPGHGTRVALAVPIHAEAAVGSVPQPTQA